MLYSCFQHVRNTRLKLDSRMLNYCKESKHTWTEWVDAGRPTSGDLYERNNSQKREVCCRINVLEAIRERRRIQRIDHGFRNQHPVGFQSQNAQFPARNFALMSAPSLRNQSSCRPGRVILALLARPKSLMLWLTRPIVTNGT